MIEGVPKQILLIAPDLLGESLSLRLNSDESDFEIILNTEDLKHPPSLIVWSLERLEKHEILSIELNRLRKRWNPSPILLLLPSKIGINSNQILDFECEGVLQSPDLEVLKASISTIANGGRVIRLNVNTNNIEKNSSSIFAVKNLLLNQGLNHINIELNKLNNILDHKNINIFLLLVAKGRKREVESARSFLMWLLSPAHMPLLLKNQDTKDNPRDYSTSITIKEKNPTAVWNEIYDRIEELINQGCINQTNIIFAIQGLQKNKQTTLFTALLNQFSKVVKNLRTLNIDNNELMNSWISLEEEIREHSVREISGNYSRLILNGESISISDHLLKNISLFENDEELPSPSFMLDSLISNKPILVEGNLLAPDDPRALLRLQMLVMNWIIRTGEIISSELISAASEWPELRDYLLDTSLISTRELERLRNQLNSQKRWHNLFSRPIQLYESKREFLLFKDGHIENILISESRDNELRKLGWWQQQVALLVEARDALAPQIQSLLKHLGDLMVVILTNVLGRAIGLVGRGIAQGMGRTISR